MIEMTPTPLPSRRRRVVVLIAAATLAASLGPAVARQCQGTHDDEQLRAADIFAENANNHPDDDIVAPAPERRHAMDQRAAFHRWGGRGRWHREGSHRTDHSVHARLAYRARALLLSRQTLGAMGVWCGPRGPPLSRARGKNFFASVFSWEVFRPDPILGNLPPKVVPDDFISTDPM